MRRCVMTWCPRALLLALLIPGCGDNPTGSSVAETATLVVRVTGETGEPLGGFAVTVMPTPLTRRTGSDGTAMFEDLPLQGYELLISGPTTQKFLATVELDRPGVSEREVVFCHSLTGQVTVQREEGNPMAGATVITYPPTDRYVTDENGRFEMVGVFLQPYTFSIAYEGVVLVAQVDTINIEKDSAEPVDLFLVFPSQVPVITIVSPEPGSFLRNGLIHFEGRGFDFEDGELADTLLTWWSSIDGLIGHGRDFVTDQLNNGLHTITLEGIDSDGAIGSSSQKLMLSVYDDTSWFPLPHDIQWTYQFDDPRVINFPENGDTEIWNVDDMYVYVNDNARISELLYTVAVLEDGSSGDYVGTTYRYLVADYFHNSPVAVYLDSTVEQLSRLTENPAVLRISTVYEPAIPVIPDQHDPGPEDAFAGTCIAQVSWEGGAAGILRESIDLAVNCEFGEQTGIETSMGSFDTIPLTITMNDQTRTWNLAKGIGVARITTSLGGQPMEATLSGMYISPVLLDMEPAAGRLPAWPAPGDPTLADMRRMLPMLRNLAP